MSVLVDVSTKLVHVYHSVPWWSWLLQTIGVVASYVGAELNARLRIEGFYVWLVANIALLVVHVASGLWALVVLDVLYFRLNFVGIRRWKRKALSAEAVA